MLCPRSSENCASAWVDAFTAAVFAPLFAAAEVTAAAASMMNAGLQRPAATASHTPQPDAHRSVPPATTGHGQKSWYRAPYRSPFDPMFWLQPGHPVDHLPETVAFAMRFGAPAWPLPAWLAGASTQAWNPWALAIRAPAAWVAPGLPSPRLPSNVIDFNAAYAAYRTAGGHATAQIVRTADTAPWLDAQASQDLQSIMLGWPLGMMFQPWIGRR